MAEHKLSYTASEIDERLGKVSSLVAKVNGITPDATGNVTLPIDTSIQQNSTNPVTGGALHNELSAFAEEVIGYVDSNIPTKTSQLTNDSGFITVVPSEYITESELTAKGYATQTSVDALSNRIDNLPTGGGSSNVIIDSEFSTTSTNPIQNKVITSAFITAEQEIENLNNRIDNLLANEDSGKELIGEFNLNNTNLTKSSTSGIYSLGSDIQTIMQNAFAKLDEGFDEVLGVITLGDVIFYAQCHYCGGSSSLNVAQNIQCVMSGMAHQNKITLYEFLKNSLRTNETTYIDYVASGTLSMNVKFYKISSGSGMGGGGVQSDWNQNDSSAPDYIKNRPFYK